MPGAERERGRSRPARGVRGKLRTAHGPAECLYGLHPVHEALRARRRRIHRLLVRSGPRGGELEALVGAARELGTPVEEVTAEVLGRRAGPEARTQGVALLADPLPELGLEALLRILPAGPRRLVALDGVEDPQNLGAIARVAEAAGVGGLVLTQRRAPPLSPAVAKASAGAIEHLPVARVVNLTRAIEALKTEGFWAFGADEEAADDVFALPDRVLSGDLLLVLGAEGRGLRQGVQAVLDHRIRVPMRGRVASLNVSAAAAVLLFELERRSRLASSHPLP